MKKRQYNLIPYEVIEKAVNGDTAALLAVERHYKAYIISLSGSNTDLQDRLNAKLLEAVLNFRIVY